MSEPVSEPEQPDSEQPGAESPGDAKAGPESLTFRILPIALIAVLALAICVTPVAFTHPAGLVLFLLPLGLGTWILRAKTVVTPEKITARALRRVEISWDDVRQFRLNERRWLRAVLGSGQEVLLPAVRVRDLPRLAAMSGARIADPSAATDRTGDAERDETIDVETPTDDARPDAAETSTPAGEDSTDESSTGNDDTAPGEGRDQH